MNQAGAWRESDIFVVRVFRSVGGDLSGVVQHVRSGEKVTFQAIDNVGDLLSRMIRPPVEPPSLATDGDAQAKKEP